MTEEELIEALADKEHASWARWQQSFFSKCLGLMSFYVHGDNREKAQAITNLLSKFEGASIIVPELVEGLQMQIETPYADLQEYEKQLDRDEVAHILPIIEAYKLRGDLTEPPTVRSTVVRWVDCNEVEHSISTIDDDEVTVRCLLLLVKQVRGEVLKITVEH